MHIQIVTFRLQGLSEADYVASCDELAPTFAGIPGLLSKVWLRDPRTGTYGGVKAWTDRAAMDSYLGGEIWRSLVADPHLVEASSRDFEILENPTRVTRGLSPVAA